MPKHIEKVVYEVNSVTVNYFYSQSLALFILEDILFLEKYFKIVVQPRTRVNPFAVFRNKMTSWGTP